MKKIISIVLLCTMLLACFAGCGAKQGQIDLNSYAGEVDAQNLSVEATHPYANRKTALDNNADKTFDGSANTDWVAANSENKTFTITTGAQLRGMVNQIAAGNTFAGWTITLGNDIDLNGQKWERIASGKYFAGTFNGNDKAIGNFYMELTTTGQGSFFGGLTADAQLKNLSVVNAEYKLALTATDKDNFGGLVNQVVTVADVKENGEVTDTNTITISNIYVHSDVEFVSTTNTAFRKYVGFIFAQASGDGKLEITNCEVAGVFDNTNTTYLGGFGGTVGLSTGGSLVMTNCHMNGSITSTGSYTAGLIGNLTGTATITNCTVLNAVNITGNKSVNAGLFGCTNGNITIKNCHVYGGVNLVNAPQTGNNLIGGLIGQQSGGDLTLDGCTVSGVVEGDRATGGLMGLYNVTTKKLTVKNCVVNANVIGSVAAEKNLGMGGLIGVVRAKTANVYGNTVNGNVDITYEPCSQTRTWNMSAGGLIGVFLDYSNSGGLLRLWNNTVAGTLKVVDNSTSTEQGIKNNAGYKVYAGIFVGSSNGLGNIEYVSNSVGPNFEIDVDSNVEIYNAGLLNADMIKVEGYQLSQKDTQNDTYNIRFVASTNGSYDAYGFVVGLKYLDAQDKVHEKLTTIYAEYLYETIKGTNEDGTVETYAAEDFYGKYLYTLEVRNVPASYVEAAVGEEKFGITLLPFGVAKETTTTEPIVTTYSEYAGIPYNYGKLPTAVAENTVALTDVGTYASLEAMYKTGDTDVTVTPTQEIGKDSYKDNLFYGVDYTNGGDDYCVYPSTNAPFNIAEFTALKNVNMMTYTVGEDVEEGTYDLVLKLRVKNTSARKLLMYLNDGEDSYLVGYDSSAVTQCSSTDTENSYYVKVGTFTFKAGDTITFKIDTGLSSAMHVRGLYLINAATDVAAAEPQA